MTDTEVSDTPVVETVEEVKEEVDIDSLPPRKRKKALYRKKLNALFDEYSKILIIQVDNVGSYQMQQVRIAIRGKGIMLLGKNTMIRSVIRERKDEKLNNLLPLVRQNMGFVFSNGNLSSLRKTIEESKVPAAARVGSIAPASVFVPPGPTGMDPGQTSFFQALGIPTKIERGNITIINEVEFVKAGDKVTSSHVVLLDRLKIMPFFYSILVSAAYDDGSTFSPEVLDLTPEDILAIFIQGASKIAALGFELGYPTAASVPFQMRYAFKKIVALSLESGYEFSQATEYAKAGVVAVVEVKEEKAAVVEESEEESSSGGALFGMDDDDEEEWEEEEEEEEDE